MKSSLPAAVDLHRFRSRTAGRARACSSRTHSGRSQWPSPPAGFGNPTLCLSACCVTADSLQFFLHFHFLSFSFHFHFVLQFLRVILSRIGVEFENETSGNWLDLIRVVNAAWWVSKASFRRLQNQLTKRPCWNRNGNMKNALYLVITCSASLFIIHSYCSGFSKLITQTERETKGKIVPTDQEKWAARWSRVGRVEGGREGGKEEAEEEGNQTLPNHPVNLPFSTTCR